MKKEIYDRVAAL